MAAKTTTETTSLNLRRVIKAPAERIYQAFLDPDALAKWIPPHVAGRGAVVSLIRSNLERPAAYYAP